MNTPTGRSESVIVHGFGVDVNGYAAFGRRPPSYQPERCPHCGRCGTFVSHDIRERAAWSKDSRRVVFIRRIKCSSGGGCRRVFTVLPSFLYPRRRYVLAEFEPVLEARFGQKHSFQELDQRLRPEVYSRPAASTHRDWCRAFRMSARRWLAELAAWSSRLDGESVLPPGVLVGPELGLLAMTLSCLDALLQVVPVPASERKETGWLEALWLWGSVRVPEPLFSPRNRGSPSLSQ